MSKSCDTASKYSFPWQVSEHASWSSQYYGRIISAALAAVDAPPDLVQIVTGCGPAFAPEKRQRLAVGYLFNHLGALDLQVC